VLAAAACAAPPAPQAAGGGESPSAPAEKITIKLAENPWTGAQVNVAVAKQLLEEQLGYTVEIVSIDENAQWPALANGDLSASLEVWPSGHAGNIAQYIDDQKVVENAGELGVVGRIGWYQPSYVVAAHPELATWEGFTNPELAGLFVVWDTPALAAATRLAERGTTLPMATVDLGEAAAIALATGNSFCCIAAQQPFLQGIAAAQTVILCLLGRPVPAWIALPGIGVTRDNVVESFQTIWRQPAPREVLHMLGLARGK